MKSLFLLGYLALTISCQASDLGQIGTQAPSHEIWDGLLKKHVDAAGVVNYKGFIADMQQLDAYLSIISENAPDRNTWSKNDQLAYWINAYNAFTVKLIADNYPVESIQDLHPKVKIPLINTVWHIKFFKIGGKDANLDEIEHKILRKEFEEPRIHFAINCASFSCPPLRNEAFVPDKLDQQLDDMARRFINDPKRNAIKKNEAELSKIFSWFKGDFTKKGSLVDYLNQYTKVKLDPKAKISYMDYDWSLNE